MNGAVEWQNGSYSYLHPDSIHHFEVFNGFQHSNFLKCFTIQYAGEEKRKVKATIFNYDKVGLDADWPISYWNGFKTSYLKVFLIIHYPGQFFLHKRNEIQVFDIFDTDRTIVRFQDLEILKRRNSRERKCSMDFDNYDNMLIDEWLRRQKCRPPYLNSHKLYPKCNTQKKIKMSKLDLQMQKKMDMTKACQRISKTKIDINQHDDPFFNVWSITIKYPEEVKIITQSKEVDVHSLIGNIGGYLGLFLGK